jgi:hypothetical protein
MAFPHARCRPSSVVACGTVKLNWYYTPKHGRWLNMAEEGVVLIVSPPRVSSTSTGTRCRMVSVTIIDARRPQALVIREDRLSNYLGKAASLSLSEA